MKAKVRKGGEHLFLQGHSNNWKKVKDTLIVNFNNRNTYLNFRQENNHLLLETTEGEVDIVFTGEIPIVIFDHFCKDQLVLKIR